MKISDLEIGQCYIYDPLNTKGQYEEGVKIVKIKNIRRYFIFTVYAECEPYIAATGKFDRDHLMKVSDSELLQPINENPEKNVIVRYPSDLPAFSDYDVHLLAKVTNEMAVKFFDQSDLSEQELLTLTGLINKIKFYADITEKYRPNGGMS